MNTALAKRQFILKPTADIPDHNASSLSHSNRQPRNVTSLITTDDHHYQRPSLRQIVNATDHIIGDSQFLLDFAIVGFGKCGTSTMMSWLGQHPEVACIHQLIRRLYRNLPAHGHFKRGYKCPADLRFCMCLTITASTGHGPN